MKIDPVAGLLFIVFGSVSIAYESLFQAAVGLALLVFGISILFRLFGRDLFYTSGL